MHALSTFRLNLLRGMYLLMFVGLATQIWPLMIQSSRNVEHFRGVVWSVLTGLSLVAALGIRYPVKMLPLLLFELAWKTIWVAAIGLPLWSAGRLDAGTAETMRACLLGVVLCPLVIPWRYVFAHYVRAPGERWRSAAAAKGTEAELAV